jgi:hypothetical protein
LIFCYFFIKKKVIKNQGLSKKYLVTSKILASKNEEELKFNNTDNNLGVLTRFTLYLFLIAPPLPLAPEGGN